MTELLIICIVSAAGSLLTLFSGFGLGTILTPFFVLFFPVEIAIAVTGVVHLFNNLFKFVLLGKYSSWSIVLQFGVPSIIGAAVGAEFLMELSTMVPWYSYELWGRTRTILPSKAVIAVLLIIFALADIIPHGKSETMNTRSMTAGGVLSGFFGGLSGFQGALRSAFLIHYGLQKEQFLATGIAIACLVDLTRLSLYSTRLFSSNAVEHWQIILAAILSAFIGAYAGNALLKKVTIVFVQRTVAVMLIVIAVAMGSGII
jgi:uncharacterized membrane protein YfcA